jgi:hypothetical protein
MPVLCATALVPQGGEAGNIVWVSDQLLVNSAASDNDGGTEGTFSAGAGPYPDEGFLALLTAAGHTVTRYNPPASPNIVSDTDVEELNGYDLVILGKSVNSALMDTADKAEPWNVKITQPILSTNPYLSRRVRLGWFEGAAGNGETTQNIYFSQLTFMDPSEAVAAYLIGDTALAGNDTADTLFEQITTFTYPDRGQNFIVNTHTPIAGGQVIATATANGGYAIVSFPAGATAIVAGVPQILGGYRLFFAAGNREPGTAPENVIGNSGFENLTADGEAMFLRAVALALNNGAVPGATPPELTMNITGNSLTLYWSDPQWHVEASDTMAHLSWTGIAGSSPLSLPMDRSARFFRLSR